ncbi:SelB translation factor [Alloiococcus otitis]|uniref:Selenocysteine-specific elongation factor n=1 Tax=Alloiococcus otitis ATCC 51267 TaxID=883081 RepID=K9E8C7_9LACT|nr:selenocysteine-specific translation elongation factor [Alloiococcus otitis]EKU93434.1 selenocysteine-specific translation elongation factor [Alloiococcus otitis ATCC 51267]SUU81435.1 SelB translation factor [Alloiococcus otitis]
MADKENLVVGTAGHVDHGKTTLIKALTGIETDTMEEEHSRGLSINLGFAYMNLENGEEVGIVDVPGHEKFLKNMLAGAPGIDLVLLVIDVNEGIMPQTIEHAAILSLLGIENFIIVLSKVDGVDKDLKEIVYEDIKDRFDGTPLAQAPIVETDAVSGTGLEALRQQITDQCQNVTNSRLDLPARMNVDRAFSVKGIGTVVTGTLKEGVLHLGDAITIYPQKIQTKIKNIQIHKEDVETAYAGNRTALNLAKVDLDQVSRGDILTTGPLKASYMLDVKVTCLPHSPYALELWDRVHVYLGSREVLARLVPIGSERVEPGQEGYLQLRLEDEVTVKKGDRFVLRSYSPLYTIAGGVVLDEAPDKHRRFNDEVIKSFEVKESGDLATLTLYFLDHRSFGLTSQKEIANYLNVEHQELEVTLEDLLADQQVYQFGQGYISENLLDQFTDQVVKLLQDYHETYPIRSGMPLEELRGNFTQVEEKDRDLLLEHLDQEEVISQDDNTVRLASFDPSLSEEQGQVKTNMEKTYKEAGFKPPKVKEVVGDDPVKVEILRSMVDHELVRIDKEVYLHQDAYQAGKEAAIEKIKADGSITLPDFRDLLGTSRKYAVSFLETLDNQGVTKRLGDKRILAK